MRRESRTRHAWVQACFAVICLTIGNEAARAVAIEYTVEQESGSTWVYTDLLRNTSQPAGVEEFRVYFALGAFADIATAASPGDWDPLVAQPDELLQADGFFDALALVSPLGLNDTQSGFQVRFTYLGVGTPGSQAFDVLDPLTFAILFSGQTEHFSEPPPVGVPAPGSAVLLATALGLLGLSRRRFAAIRNSRS